MPQKPLKKKTANKKAPAANRHGKVSKTRKGEEFKGGAGTATIFTHMECMRLGGKQLRRAGIPDAESMAPLSPRAGRMEKIPKIKRLVKQYNEEQELTKSINYENEQRVAGVAAAAGGKLSVLKPPVLESADSKQKKKAKGAAIRAGLPFGAGSK